MGEEVLPSYLRSKLSSILEEAEADSDSGSPSHIISRFRSIETQIKSNSPMMILYELIELASECRVFAYKRRTAAVSKKGFGFSYLYFPKQLLLLHPLSELMFNRRMRRRLDTIQRKIGDCTASHPPPPPPSLPVMEETYPIEYPSLIIGFEAQAEKIEAWLMPNQEEEEEEGNDAAAALKLRAVGIVGRCGCGKTALAQKVFASPRIVNEFSPRIWVSLSNMLLDDDRVNPRVRVVNYILREIDDDGDSSDDHCSLDNLKEKLERGLMGKRYLIVLDDAGLNRGLLLSDLSLGLPKGGGGAVIVTGRREDVVGRMVGDNKHVIRLQESHLSDEISWQIFCKLVEGKMETTHPVLSTIRDDVITSSDRLPLALKSLANILPPLLLKSYWIRARDLTIAWGHDDRYWRWTSLPPPQEMEEVAELVRVCWLDIKGSVDLKELLFQSSYSAYLVFKLTREHGGLNEAVTARVSIVCDGRNPEGEEERSVFIDDQGEWGEREGEEGWMEIKLGDIFTTFGDNGRLFEASLFEVQNNAWKSGLVVRGIEFRHNYN